MADIVYSIIIPHKNIPNLLARCLASIPLRDDVEVVVVDDNSDSEIVDFSRFPGLNRPNTSIIFDKSGKGAGRARNIGIDNANGEWLLFVDADDFFNYCISDIFDKYQNVQEDVVYFNANSLDTDTYMNRNRAWHLNEFIELWNIDKKESEKKLRFEFGEPWSKIVKRQMVTEKKIRFDETPIHNDTTFSYLVGYYAKTIAVEPKAGYCITVRKGSTSVSINEEKEFVRVDVFSRSERFFIDHGIKVNVYRHYNQVAKLFLRSRSLGEKGMGILAKYQIPRCKAIIKVSYYLVKNVIKGVITRNPNIGLM